MGFRNTANGYEALYSNASGHNNVAIGYHALYSNTIGDFNTAIGYNADVSSSSLTNATAIGYDAEVNASNKVVIGNSSVGTIGGYADWTNYSDKRFKENIEYQDDLGLDFIMKLKTVSFNYKDDKKQRRRDGLIAQDVEAALEKIGAEFSGLVIDDDEQKTMNLAYGNFVLPLINAVKEQQNTIEEQQRRIESLEAEIETMKGK
ncbi:tail fiber domain-containing protein [bacterium]